MREKSLFAVILGLALLRIYDLDFAEVQAWDEAMYAVRARSILLFGDWLDQSAHSVGGLYSAAHPPLYIWLTAIAMKLFGETAFSIRLWSAIFGAGTVLLLYFLPRDRLSGFFSAFILGTNAFFSFYSRQGQLDVILTFFIVLGIFSYIRYETNCRTGWLVLTGLAFGSAFMSKIIVGLFLPMALGAYLLFLVLRRDRRFSVAALQWFTVFGVGLVLAAPWHIYMFLEHGRSFLDQYFIFHVLQRSIVGVELNVQTLGPLFFTNQLIVLFSAAAAVAAWHICRLSFRRGNLSLFYLFAFLLPFIVFSLSRTQLRTYAIPMLPPLALLGGEGLRRLWSDDRISWTVFAGAVIFSIWAASQDLRDAVAELFVRPQFEPVLVASVLFCLLCVLLIHAARRITGRGFVFMVLCVLIIFSFARPVEFSRSSISAVADRFEKDDCRNLIFMDKVRVVHSPHISWYFGGIDLGWQEDRTFRLVQPEDTHELNLESTDCAYIIINQREEHQEFEKIGAVLKEGAFTIIEGEHYHVYRLERTPGRTLGSGQALSPSDDELGEKDKQ